MYNLFQNNSFLILLQALHIMQQPHSGQSHFSKVTPFFLLQIKVIFQECFNHLTFHDSDCLVSFKVFSFPLLGKHCAVIVYMSLCLQEILFFIVLFSPYYHQKKKKKKSQNQNMKTLIIIRLHFLPQTYFHVSQQTYPICHVSSSYKISAMADFLFPFHN